MRLTFRVPRYFLVLTLVWIAAISWKIYPHFRDGMRSEGHVISFADYVEDSCGQRVGASAEICYIKAVATGRKLVAKEQAKAILLILAPLIIYGVFYLPLSLLAGWVRRISHNLGRRVPLFSRSPVITSAADHA